MARRDPGYSDFMEWMLKEGVGRKQASAERSYMRHISAANEEDYSRSRLAALEHALEHVVVPDSSLPSRHNHRRALRRYIEYVEALQDKAAAISLAAARAEVRDEHVKEAARRIEEKGDGGLAWLYEQTGRRQARHRYVLVNDVPYPTKAFGFLVAQLAGDTDSTANALTTNEAYAPLKRLGYREVSGAPQPRSRAEDDAREVDYYKRLARPQQAAFRRALLSAYDGACALSGVAVAGSLEAAHVIEFGVGEDTLSNGVLLRADLHRLFDRGLLAFEPRTLCAYFAPSCLPDYEGLAGVRLKLPQGGPPASAFAQRWDLFTLSR